MEYISDYFSIQLVLWNIHRRHDTVHTVDCGFEYAMSKQVKDLQVPVEKVSLFCLFHYFCVRQKVIKMLWPLAWPGDPSLKKIKSKLLQSAPCNKGHAIIFQDMEKGVV